MGQPKWKEICSADFYRVLMDEAGEYPEECEIASEIDDENFLVYRFSIDRLKACGGMLIPVAYRDDWTHPMERYDEWFNKDLVSVANSTGENETELREAFTSTDAVKRFWAYYSVGNHFGFDNFDSEPLKLTTEELNKRWS